MYCLSIVTFNRRDILKGTLEAIWQTTQRENEEEGVQVVVTDNASSDSTGEMLQEYERQGKLKCWLLKQNVGTSGGRNAHWGECIGHDSVRMDDKSLPLCSGWLTAMRRLSYLHHSIVAPPYDPTVQGLTRLAPCVPLVNWPQDSGQGGPVIFIPAEVTQQLGGIDQFADAVYGWDDVSQIRRAMLLGWGFGFELRTPWRFTASASPERRAKAMEYHGLYVETMRQYAAGERDIYIPVESTLGYKLGKEVRG